MATPADLEKSGEEETSITESIVWTGGHGGTTLSAKNKYRRPASSCKYKDVGIGC